jgi:glutamate-1-semialdehyde aminotransferase
MNAYDRAAIERTNQLGDRLRTGLESVMQRLNVPAAVTGYGSLIGLHLGVTQVDSYRDAARADKALGRLLHLALLLDGVFCAPRLMWCTSTAMDEALVDDVLGRVERSVSRVLPALTRA